MKIKTSITLSEELLRGIDARVERQKRSRSEFIEEAVRAFLAQADRVALQARETALLRQHAAALNAEMTDVSNTRSSREARRNLLCRPPLPDRSQTLPGLRGR